MTLSCNVCEHVRAFFKRLPHIPTPASITFAYFVFKFTDMSSVQKLKFAPWKKNSHEAAPLLSWDYRVISHIPVISYCIRNKKVVKCWLCCRWCGRNTKSSLTHMSCQCSVCYIWLNLRGRWRNLTECILNTVGPSGEADFRRRLFGKGYDPESICWATESDFFLFFKSSWLTSECRTNPK